MYEKPVLDTGLRRPAWLAAGVMCLALGVIGIVVPLLPTVDMVGLAAFCFARSSDRLHDWLLHHSTFGPAIQNWRDHGAISRRAKRLATVSILAAFSLSVALGLGPKILTAQAITLGLVSLFIWSRPES